MPIFHALNLVLAGLLLLWPVWFSSRILRLPLLNPFTIALAVSLPVEVMKLFGGPMVLLDAGFADPGYQFAVFASNTLVLSQIMGLLLMLRMAGALRIDRWLPGRRVIISPRTFRRGARLFAVVYLACFYALASAEFGLANWLANPREGYQLYRTGQGHWYALCITALSAAQAFSFLGKPTGAAVLCRLPIFLGMAYLLGSKLVMLNIFVSALVFLWFIRWKHLTKLIVLGAPLIFLLLIWNLVLALSDGFELLSILEYFDYYKNAADYYNAYMRREIPLFWGEIGATSFASYVPRALWPDKPSVYGILIINEIFYPGQAELTNTPAFGGAVEQFADFGFPGLVMSGVFGSFAIVTAATSYLVFRRPGFELSRVTLLTALAMLVQFVPTFGMFFPGILYLGLLMAVGATLLAIRNRRWRVTAVVGSEIAGKRGLSRGAYPVVKN